MKVKKLFPFIILLALLTSLTAFPASAEDAPEGKYELTATFITNGKLITHRWYDDLDELWNNIGPVAASDRTTEIKLHANWDIYEEKTLSIEHCNVYIDLNGHSIIRHTDNDKQVRNGGVFVLDLGARLTVLDSDPASAGYDGIRGGVITGGASTNSGGAFTVKDKSELTITGGTIYRCTTNEHGGAVMITGGSKEPTFEMTGGRIYACQSIGAFFNCHGGAVYADKANVSLSNCIIDSCYSEDNGGAIYLNNGSMRIDNVRFTGNHCLDFGGAVFVSGGSLRVFRSRFSTNEAKRDGGAVYVDSNNGAQFRDCVFNKNKSYGSGGAIYVNGDRTFLIDTDVIANSAAGYGGGVFVDADYGSCYIGVKGLVRIYNNSGKNHRDNLTLSDGIAVSAYLTSGGLYEGSKIGLSSTGQNVKYADEISRYQLETLECFFSDTNGSIKIYNSMEYEREAPMLASVFSGGGYIWLAAGLSLSAVCGAAAYIIIIKNKKAKEEKRG